GRPAPRNICAVAVRTGGDRRGIEGGRPERIREADERADRPRRQGWLFGLHVLPYFLGASARIRHSAAVRSWPVNSLSAAIAANRYGDSSGFFLLSAVVNSAASFSSSIRSRTTKSNRCICGHGSASATGRSAEKSGRR